MLFLLSIPIVGFITGILGNVLYRFIELNYPEYTPSESLEDFTFKCTMIGFFWPVFVLVSILLLLYYIVYYSINSLGYLIFSMFKKKGK